jgi:hypothetical protein
MMPFRPTRTDTQLRLAALFVLVGCATAPPPRAIEPPPAGASADSRFVLARDPPSEKPAQEVQIHINNEWWRFRARALGLSEAQARQRDEEMSEKEAPPEFWDMQVAIEAASLWETFCNECHGGRRRIDEARTMPVPAPAWGQGTGLFFGNRRAYAEIFATILNGKIDKVANRPRMPAWRGKLSREMIWGLIYFIEYQSGGIEGRFPPSLYPRSENLDRR